MSVVFLPHRVTIFLVDFLAERSYTTSMDKTTKSRKKRSDRNHIIYELRVPMGNYIGVTAKTETTVMKSLRSRAAKHFYRAKNENKTWLLCRALRNLAHWDEIEILVHRVIRGKALAHREEVRIRREVQPNLNTDCRGD